MNTKCKLDSRGMHGISNLRTVYIEYMDNGLDIEKLILWCEECGALITDYNYYGRETELPKCHQQ